MVSDKLVQKGGALQSMRDLEVPKGNANLGVEMDQSKTILFDPLVSLSSRVTM